MESEERKKSGGEINTFVEKRYRLEKARFFVTTAAVGITLFSLIFGFIKFFNERNREYNSLYRSTLSKLLAGDAETQKSALIEVSKFTDKKDEYIPLLITLMNERHMNNNRALDKYFAIAFIASGKQMIDELAISNLNAQKTFDQDLCKSTGWGICQILKNASGKSGYQYDLAGVLLNDNVLNNLNISKVLLQKSKINRINFDNTAFQKCDFSQTIFRDASFWKTKFSEDVNLKDAQFVDCNLQEAIFDCDLKHTEFQECNVLDLQVTDKGNTKADTFSSCINASTVIYKQP